MPTGNSNMALVLPRLLSTAAVWCLFFQGSVLHATEPKDDRWDVAQDSRPEPKRAPEARPHAKNERWLNRPLTVALSTIVGETPSLDYMFLMPGAELSYALPRITFSGTIGYFGSVNASLAARGRLHVGDAVALTLGARSSLLSLNRICWGECAEGNQEWDQSLFLGGELGVEGRSETGFMWRVQAGLSGMLVEGRGSCTNQGAYRCSVQEPTPGPLITQELTLGYAF